MDSHSGAMDNGDDDAAHGGLTQPQTPPLYTQVAAPLDIQEVLIQDYANDPSSVHEVGILLESD